MNHVQSILLEETLVKRLPLASNSMPLSWTGGHSLSRDLHVRKLGPAQYVYRVLSANII
jgi:hypothetical protein